MSSSTISALRIVHCPGSSSRAPPVSRLQPQGVRLRDSSSSHLSSPLRSSTWHKTKRLHSQSRVASTSTTNSSSSIGTFAEKKRASVDTPAVCIFVNAEDVDDDAYARALDEAIGAGARVVVVTANDAANSAKLFDAAGKLRAQIRDRAVLLVDGPADVAAAAEATGVCVDATGLPTEVVRRTLKAVGGDGAPALVVRRCATPDDVATASQQGADAVILLGASTTSTAPDVVLAEARARTSVPLLADARGASVADAVGRARAATTTGADGITINVAELASAPEGPANAAAALLAELAKAAAVQEEEEEEQQQQQQQEEEEERSTTTASNVAVANDASAAVVVEEELSTTQSTADRLRANEAELLERLYSFLRDDVPVTLEELDLLPDCMAALADPILCVVVGEFNAGKSTLLNALLGGAFLQEGILPTTNEVTELRYLAPERDERSGKVDFVSDVVRTSDGRFQRGIGAPVLKRMCLVDTPGTNVVLKRQKQLTEEYIPRADLVLFVVSADRPFTESETKFLSYIQDWGKKVVFVVNKADLLSNDDERAQVREYVQRNAREILNVADAMVFEVSARGALNAKKAVRDRLGIPYAPSSGNTEDALEAEVLEAYDRVGEELAKDANYTASNFDAVEALLKSYVSADSSRAAEAARLKLTTPLNVSNALLTAAGASVAELRMRAEAEVNALSSVQAQVAGFEEDMKKDAMMQKGRVSDAIRRAVERGGGYFDRVIRLSNYGQVIKYALGGDGEEEEEDGAAAVEEMSEEAKEVMKLVDDGDKARVAAIAESGGGGGDSGWRAIVEGEIAGESLGSLTSAATEFVNWCAENRDRAMENYDVYLQERAEALDVLQAPPAVDRDDDTKAAAAEGDTDDDLETPSDVIASVNADAAATALANEVREASSGVVRGIASAVAVGFVLTSVMDSATSDALSVVLALGVAYVSLVNLPLKRSSAKGKLRDAADGFESRLLDAMDRELERGCLRDVRVEMMGRSGVLLERANVLVELLVEMESKIGGLQDEVVRLKREVDEI